METLLISLCLFICFEFIVPLENISLIWRRHYCRWRASNHDLCSALMAIEQWGFFNVQHLLWHGPTVYIVHLRGLMTLTPIAERFDSGGVTNWFTTSVCRGRESNPDRSHARRRLYLYASRKLRGLITEFIVHRL